MKKIFLVFLIVLILVVGAIIWNHNNNKEKYEKLINEYMVDLASKQKETTCFYGVKYFGKNYENIYAWVVEQCYYASNNKIVKDSGSSMAYRFYQENDVIKSFENPDDGENYEKSMEELFPVIVRNKMAKYSTKGTQKISDDLDSLAKKHFNLSDITYESNAQNSTYGDITGIKVKKTKIKKLLTLDERVIYGPKNSVFLYDKNNSEHELIDALENDIFNLEQIEEYLIFESDNGNINVEELEEGASSIYRGEDYTIIACHNSDNNNIYFGDNSLEYKTSYCK